ncbi:MAG: hypothetical protein ACP5M0_07235 [Desulfomonilaceae bacterium]
METDANIVYDHILIREATILVRAPKNQSGVHQMEEARFFDVRTGVELREIYPPLQAAELKRGFIVSEACAASVLKTGIPIGPSPDVDYTKVVNILDLRQRRLDALVADSIIDQVRVIKDLLTEFLDAAEKAQKEERFWLSQQVLSLVHKFTGRELSELQDIIGWFRKRYSGK